jgi:hypothetical protein
MFETSIRSKARRAGRGRGIPLWLAALYLWPGVACAAQAERIVQFHIATKTEPVVITKVTLGNVVVQAGRWAKPIGTAPDPMTPFQADDDWVGNLTVCVLNRTTRGRVVYMSMHFSFPETGDGRTTPRYMYALTLGRVPSAAAFEIGRPLRLPVDSKPISFGPGQVLAVSLDNYISGIQPHVPLATLTKMTIDFGLVYFADGLR